MQFIDRKAKYPNRWTLVKEDGTSEVVTLVRNDEPIVEGTPMNADTLNTLSDVAGADVARLQAESAAAEAKSYQDAAAGSASAAASSESAAKSSADSAKTSQTAASKSEANAKSSATAAKTSEANAKNSETNAASSASAAKMSAANAAASETNAKASADHAAAIVSTDKTLKVDGAPADAKATGKALLGILDAVCPPIEETGNPVQVSDPVPGYPLGVTASWEPTQEGTGDPSPENIRPITGRDSVTVTRQEDGPTTTLTLPATVYGGSVDVVTGEGQETWRLVTLNGQTESIGKLDLSGGEIEFYYALDTSKWSFGDGNTVNCVCNQYVARTREEVWHKSYGIAVRDNYIRIYDPAYKTVEDFKAWLAAQYAAGTPVQVAYKLAEPVAFTATGGQDIPALDGVNTFTTDADSLTVTGRADPIQRVTALEDAVASMTNNE